jgi:hypothetical protein
MLAWALLAIGLTDEAAEVVDAFSPIPPGSQWGYSNSIVAHLVLAHSDGPLAAGRSLALVAQKAVPRRPLIRGEFLTGFAYLRHISGATERAKYINERTLAIGLGSVRLAMLFGKARVTGEDAIELIEAHAEELPALELYRLSTEHGPRLLTEEVERWS